MINRLKKRIPLARRKKLDRLDKEFKHFKAKAEQYSKERAITDSKFKLFFEYQKWLKTNYPNKKLLNEQASLSQKFKYRPLISVLIPVYKTPIDLLRECFDSVISQSYDNWELCVVDDCSKDPVLTTLLKEYATKYPSKFKHKARQKNGHISKTSNDALALAEGEFIALLDHDDVMWPNALFEVVNSLNENKDSDLLYTDEDKLEDALVHSHPYQKPSYNSMYLLGCNYITHLAVLRTTLVKDIGGFREKVEGAQDWDLFLRISQKTNKITHIPKIVYSWRVIESSTAQGGFTAKPYAYEAQRKAVMDSCKERGMDVIDAELPQGYVGWMLKFSPMTQNTIACVIDNPYDMGSIRNIVNKVSDSLGEEFKVKFYIKRANLKNKYITVDRLFYRKQKPEFFDDLSEISLKEQFVIYSNNAIDLQGEAGWLNNIMGYLHTKDVGAVTTTIRNRQHTVLSAGVVLDAHKEPIFLLNDYIQSTDQRLDTALLSPRTVEAADQRFFVTKAEYFSKYCANPVAINKSLVKGEVLYVPFLDVFANSDPTAMHDVKSANKYTYKLSKDNPYWGADTIVS
jgi:O-antigen biosynthesis protein